MSEFSQEPCKRCGNISNPDTDYGCPSSDKEDCNWFIREEVEAGKEELPIEDIIYEYMQHLHKHPVVKSNLPLNDEVDHISEWWQDNKAQWIVEMQKRGA